MPYLPCQWFLPLLEAYVLGLSCNSCFFVAIPSAWFTLQRCLPCRPSFFYGAQLPTTGNSDMLAQDEWGFPVLICVFKDSGLIRHTGLAFMRLDHPVCIIDGKIHRGYVLLYDTDCTTAGFRNFNMAEHPDYSFRPICTVRWTTSLVRLLTTIPHHIYNILLNNCRHFAYRTFLYLQHWRVVDDDAVQRVKDFMDITRLEDVILTLFGVGVASVFGML